MKRLYLPITHMGRGILEELPITYYLLLNQAPIPEYCFKPFFQSQRLIK